MVVVSDAMLQVKKQASSEDSGGARHFFLPLLGQSGGPFPHT
jgi:hypothetical protein